ncbi:type III-A CRISPR-associated protein Csm2 [Pasteurella atlantica]|uniref:type III-A CRISPR-associated protein Csm2 n=1 Tax=Pasteurellaceae TaxID=712 RepID=UPI0027461F36|nr:type III-A CRISPR-associated protein Csm2 [Pasteurella atlantica]MDP8033565.1 type III-A CRISPR-associated protein Csm2 [Pasteurella atlantica]MDP8035500.1 type III-A CRISPR-associated protein Csm2 [Pasteurella atlantica]MDP8037451.1 type III-A CRISPR-associated protein Csm2 [Pasteurella atlantica]MDP8047800.1 type III-A CRISPR-associated protein Csm2 [Pasteurella atlantica]MDP8049639.1 type III-A CRISPR-associated protein Csm2 [Pasteurella atlantica]
MDTNKIDFKIVDSELFGNIAQEAAKYIKHTDKCNKHTFYDKKLRKEKKQCNEKSNKQTQLRKFYDELAMWNEKVQLNRENRDEEYKKQEVFIKMLKAKVAYAEGRGHIDIHFSEVFNQVMDQIENAITLKYAKLFMEAVMGYCKYFEEKNKN